MTELAREFITILQQIAPAWRTAYYRFQYEGDETRSNASYVDASGAALISAVRNRDLFNRMGALAGKLLSLLSKERGLILVTVESDFTYDVKFEFEDLGKWEITLLDGASGIPKGLEAKSG